MIVFYDPATLRVGHVVTSFSPEFREHLETISGWIETDADIPAERCAVINDGGTLRVVERSPADCSLDDYKARAEQAFDLHLPPRRRDGSMDAYKIAQASAVLAGGASSLLTAEAALRGMTPEALAHAIQVAAAAGEAAELERVAAKLAIRAAATHAAVRAILADLSIPFDA